MNKLPTSIRNAIIKPTDNVCVYCGYVGDAREFEVDHVIARKLGGTDALSNLVAACVPCNRSKSAQTLDNASVWAGRSKYRRMSDEEKISNNFDEMREIMLTLRSASSSM